MKNFSKLAVTLMAVLAGVVILGVPVKASNGIPSQVEFLQKQMNIQMAENEKAKDYFKLQAEKAKAEKRRISDIECVKAQALQGTIYGNNNLLTLGDTVMPVSNVDPYGAGNIALMDQAAYEGFVSGMALLEKIKQETWMQYTFRTH